MENKSMPWHYAMCIKADCKVANKCLRFKEWSELDNAEENVVVVNPHVVSGDRRCKQFRLGRRKRYALGFTNFKERMFPGQYLQFMDICIQHFGRTAYFRKRNGEKPLSPEEQKYLLSVLKQIGIKEKLSFDAYKDMYCYD